jgi:hypothetical protein
MRFASVVLATAVLFASSDFVVAEKEKGEKASTLFKDDQSYWTRLLGNRKYFEGSMTPPPSPRPTLAPPTPEPTPTPPPPTCLVDVSIPLLQQT